MVYRLKAFYKCASADQKLAYMLQKALFSDRSEIQNLQARPTKDKVEVDELGWLGSEGFYQPLIWPF